MADPSEPSGARPESGSDDGDAGARDDGGTTDDGQEGPEPTEPVRDAETAAEAGSGTPPDPETLRERVEARYDFERFSPADMAEMTVEEWEAAFDSDAWITGTELLDRVEADLRSRVARREVFAVVERTEVGGEDRVLAYTDVGYALVAPDGSVEGEGAVLEDVEPAVALCSMPDYDVPEPPADAGLPHPDEIPEGSGGIGDRLLLAVAGVQVVAGLLLLLSPVFLDLDPAGPGGGSGLLTTVAGLGFLFVGVLIGVLVANARLSGRFRAEEYRQRLAAAGVGTGERPAFLPVEDGDSDASDATGEGGRDRTADEGRGPVADDGRDPAADPPDGRSEPAPD